MRRIVSCVMLTLLLVGVWALAFEVGLVRGQAETIYINADGSITPPTAPIYTADNITYTLTANITANSNAIVIERNNIVLNGAGYTVTGSLSGNGTTLAHISNVTINNIMIKDFGTGILLDYSSNCTLSGNHITTNKYDGFMLVSSSNCTLSGNNVTHNDYGIDLESSDDNTLSGNNVTDSVYSIYFDSSSNCTLSGNYVTVDSTYGIWLDSSSNCTLSGNTVTNGNNGVALSSFSNSNVLSGNNITANNGYGIYFDYSSNCTLSGNSVTNNDYGIWLASSSNNFIFHNDFVNNTNEVVTDGLANVWDNGSSGNYWSDYVTKYPNAAQVDSSGVWNTPYVIDSNNTDDYPLVEPYFGLHEVGITALNLSKTVVGRGYGLNVTFTATDFGDYSETFNVTVYANATVVASQNVTLSGGTSATIALSYNTSGLTYGSYSISAYAWPVPGQTNTANNNCTGGNVVVTIPGDVDGNGIVNKGDVVSILYAFGSTPGKLNWNPNCDIEGTGKVDMTDVMIALYNFGQHYP